MKLELSKQEWAWLYRYIGSGNDLELGPVYARMKNQAERIDKIRQLNAEADDCQFKMQELRQKAANLEKDL
jgi:hypothetical protein